MLTNWKNAFLNKIYPNCSIFFIADHIKQMIEIIKILPPKNKKYPKKFGNR